MKSVNKKYYTLQQVTKITNIPTHTLKFWQREFEFQLKQNSTGRKIFAQDDVDKLLLIKYLRHQEKLTLAGIKKRLAEIKVTSKNRNMKTKKQNLFWLQKELLTIKNILSQPINK